jgi:3-oxo-4,17-pregnadiene-20-carboxyl-CoA hydratase alpha subunit
MPTEPTNLRHGTWEEAEAMVGQVISVQTGADPVSAADIRRKLEIIGWDEPLHTNEDAARQLGHRTIVSPGSMLRTWVTPAYWAPGDPALDDQQLVPPIALAAVPAPVHKLFATDSTTRHIAPVYVGDRITATARLKSVARKRTSVGNGAFMVVETTYTNQDGDVVAVESLTAFRFGEDAG